MDSKKSHCFVERVIELVSSSRGVILGDHRAETSEQLGRVFSGPVAFLQHAMQTLEDRGDRAAAEVFLNIISVCNSEEDFGGIGIHDAPWVSVSPEVLGEVEFRVQSWLRALDAQRHARQLPRPLEERPSTRRPMNMTEKLLAHHSFSVPRAEGVKAGDILRVSIDWIIASELSWMGMKNSLRTTSLKAQVWRNDRFWLSGDHTVDPRTYHQKGAKRLLDGLHSAKRELQMTENQGANYTIMHTEFARERVEPGMLVIGSDSHTCSAGSVSALAIGLGAIDAMAALITGESWFRVPETIRINFVGQPAWYTGGKDIILSILQKLKRNTAAAERVVEFGGPGAESLSCDARFAICNMCTELGAISGIFVPDAVTQAFVAQRKLPMYKRNAICFTPDDRASYAETFEIDLNSLDSCIAIYPSPDNVLPVSECESMKFDGCFIGSCTTTEEDLVLAALVLRAGQKRGLPLVNGKRLVVPGSRPIVRFLQDMGLMEVYLACGFEQPAPGCSLCLAIGADVAEPGSCWLSSQNRNFENRMGKGAIGHICSAATVAASSFSMMLTDPKDLLNDVDRDEYHIILAKGRSKASRGRKPPSEAGGTRELQYVEPAFVTEPVMMPDTDACVSLGGTIQSRIYRMGDFIDTDAIIPGPACVSCTTDEELGAHCLERFDPEFRAAVQRGQTVVVGGKAFGCGSSREEAVRALKGAGVKCVIARSFSFIFGRNMPNMGMLGIVIQDEDFYALAAHDQGIEVNVANRKIRVADREFPFALDEMELRLIENDGLAASLDHAGSAVFAALCRSETNAINSRASDGSSSSCGSSQGDLQW